MTNLETRITTYPALPTTDITPLELLVLSNVLDCSDIDEGLVLFTDMGPQNPICVKRRELIEAFYASRRQSTLWSFIASQVLAHPPAGDIDPDDPIEIDMSELPWQFVVQDILARSMTARELVVIEWMNHPSQRPETFGTRVSLITANGIHHITSDELLAHYRRQDRGSAKPVIFGDRNWINESIATEDRLLKLLRAIRRFIGRLR